MVGADTSLNETAEKGVIFMRFVAPSVILFLALTMSASAHTGHLPMGDGGLAAGFAHPFAGFDHLLAMLAVGLWATMIGGRAMIVLPLAFPAVMALGAGLAMGGLSLPLVEPALALTVVGLGLALSLAWKAALPAATALVGCFALIHGFAHGGELPAHASPSSFMAGFVAATLVLHICGIGAGAALARPRHALGARATGLVIGLCGASLLLG